MNERIEKISEQARQYADSMYPSGLDIAKWGPAYQEKFAELIVLECAGKVDWILAEGGKTQGDLIKEHFGVEEQVNDSKELHTCPYREEIHNDYESLCDCDEEQQHQCAMDI